MKVSIEVFTISQKTTSPKVKSKIANSILLSLKKTAKTNTTIATTRCILMLRSFLMQYIKPLMAKEKLFFKLRNSLQLIFIMLINLKSVINFCSILVFLKQAFPCFALFLNRLHWFRDHSLIDVAWNG